MEIVASEMSVELEDDEYLSYVYLRDREQDYVLSLSRSFVPGEEDEAIEVMVLDQMCDQVDFLVCEASWSSLRVEVPRNLRKYTNGDQFITARLSISDAERDAMFATLTRIFRGIAGLRVHRSESNDRAT